MVDDVRRANNDHYISQFHLRLFADSQDCLHILNVKDKSTQCIQNASKSKIESFCRRNWSANQKIENIFGDVETKVSPAFKQLSSDPSKFAGYSKRTKELILEYIGINYIRSLEAPKSMEESSGAIESATNELVGSKDFKLSDLGIESLTRESELSVFAKVALRLLETLGNKNVIIATPPKHNQFIISDRPLSKISIHTSEHQSKSIDDTSTIFWMPISSKVGLLFESFSTKKIQNCCRLTKSLVKSFNKSQVHHALYNVAGGSQPLLKSLSRHVPGAVSRSTGSVLGENIIMIDNTHSWYKFSLEESEEIVKFMEANNAPL